MLIRKSTQYPGLFSHHSINMGTQTLAPTEKCLKNISLKKHKINNLQYTETSAGYFRTH